MNKLLLFIPLFFTVQSFAQDQEDDVQGAFDFWVGEWDAFWRPNDSTYFKGENIITKTCDGKVIYENFSDPNNEFYGNSLTVWSPADSSWHQAWTDNQGGYLEFEGIIDGDRRIFQTEVVEVDDKQVVRRMIFYNIQEDSFMWDWEISVDGGETWKLRWQILYNRKK